MVFHLKARYNSNNNFREDFMKFSGINQKTYKERILIPYQKEVDIAKKYRPLAIVGIIIAIPILIWATNVSEDDSSTFILVASIGLSIPIFSTLGLASYMNTRKRYKGQLNLEKRQIEIKVLKNLHIQVYEQGVLKAIIKRVDSMFLDTISYCYVIKGNISTGDTLASEYKISMAILNIEQLVPYLQINKLIQNNLKFQNTTLKNIMHMDEEIRKKLFIKELTDANFLVFGVLSKNNALKNNTISIYQDIYLELANNQESFHVYTSIIEVHKELLKTYPIPYVISLKTLIEQTQTNNPLEVFKEQHPFGIVINPNNEQLTLSYEQLSKIFQIQIKGNKNDI